MARKLTDEDVESICKRCEAGEAQKDVAARYGVSPVYVSRIVRGMARSQIGAKPGRLAGSVPTPRVVDSRRFSPEEVIRIRERRASGASEADLAREIGISHQAISMICLGRAYKDVGGPIVEPGVAWARPIRRSTGEAMEALDTLTEDARGAIEGAIQSAASGDGRMRRVWGLLRGFLRAARRLA